MIKYLLKKEKNDSRVLYEQIFDDKERFVDYYYHEKAQKNNILVCFQDKQIVSMLHRAPYLVNLKSYKERIDYLYAIATKTDYRRKGIMARVLSRALQDMFNEQIPFTYLVPEDANVYLSHGFRYIYHCMEADFRANKIDFAPEYSIKGVDEQNIGELIEFSNRSISIQHDLFLNRDIIYYLDIIKRLNTENGNIELFYQSGTLMGYAYVSNDEKVEILEFVCPSRDKEIFIAHLSKKYNFKKVRIRGILYPWAECEPVPRVMARVLDIKEIGKYLVPKKEFSIKLQIIDSIIEQNNEVFTFKGNKTECLFQLSDGKPDIILDIAEFTLWLFGHTEINKMPEVKRISGTFINDIV